MAWSLYFPFKTKLKFLRAQQFIHINVVWPSNFYQDKWSCGSLDILFTLRSTGSDSADIDFGVNSIVTYFAKLKTMMESGEIC